MGEIFSGMRHGASCHYALMPVIDGQWMKCTCVNKIPQGEKDRENIRILKGKSPVTDKFQQYKLNLRMNIKAVMSQKDLTPDQILDKIVAIVINAKDPRKEN